MHEDDVMKLKIAVYYCQLYSECWEVGETALKSKKIVLIIREMKSHMNTETFGLFNAPEMLVNHRHYAQMV